MSKLNIKATTHGKNLDWEIFESPVTTINPFGEQITLDKKVIFNGSTGLDLSVRSKDYHALPNGRFTEICNLIAERHGLTISHYTSSNGGKKVLCAFQRPEQPFSIGEWAIDNHLILINSHDGSKMFEVGSNNRLHRCDNMFRSTFVEIKIAHNRFMWERIEEFESAVMGYDKNLQQELSTIEKFMQVDIDPLILKKAKELVFCAAANGGKEASTTIAHKMMRFDESMTQELAALGNNAFGLFNGVTHYTTHNMLLKEREAYDWPLFDTAAAINEKAFAFCAALVGN